MSSWKYIVVLLIASIVYLFLPVIPKLGVSEVKGIYFFPLILGGSVYINVIAIENIVKGIRSTAYENNLQVRKIRCVLRKIGWGMFVVFFCIGNILLIEASDTIVSAEIRTIAHYRYRVYGYMYIHMDEVYNLAKHISEHIPSEYSVIYPNSGWRRMERIILDILIDNELLSTSDGSRGLYIPLFYSTYGVWIRGAYKIVKFRVSDDEYLELVANFSVGGIIEDPYCKTNHTQIKLLFPNSLIIGISSYYTLIVLNYW